MKDKRTRLCEDGEMRKANEVLDLVLRRLNIDGSSPSTKLGFSWQQIIGDRLYPHIKIVEIRHNTLVLRADHPSWGQIALMQQKRILTKLHEQYPSLEIASIQLIT
jgi:hypothetical protein